jgi:hypothetical protein
MQNNIRGFFFSEFEFRTFNSLNQFSFNIQTIVETLKYCFSYNFNGNSVDTFIKWNNNTNLRVILNVDENCIDSLVRICFGGIIINSSGCYSSRFSTSFKGHLILCLLSCMLSIWAFHFGQRHENWRTCLQFSLFTLYQPYQCLDVKYHVHIVLIQNINDQLSHNNVTFCHTCKLETSSDVDIFLLLI